MVYMYKKRGCLKSKGQTSMEYLFIVGISLAILIPAAYLFYGYSKSSNDSTIKSQISKIGSTIMNKAQTIYGLSEGSVAVIELSYPNNIRDIYILNNNELILEYEVSAGTSESVFFAPINITGPYYLNNRTECNCTVQIQNSSISKGYPQQGKHLIRIESRRDHVLITTVQ